MSSNESNDILENNFLKVFSLVQLAQWAVGSMRVTINKGIVGPTNIRHNLYSLFLLILATFSESSYQMYFYDKYIVTDRNLILYYSCLVGMMAEFLSYIVCLYAARFTNRTSNLAIYSTLQNIDRILELHRTDYYYSFQTRQVKLNVLISFTLFPCGLIMNTLSVLPKPHHAWFLIPAHLTIYMDTVLFTTILYFLAVRTSVYNKMIENRIGEFVMKPKTKAPKTLVKIISSLLFPSYDGIDNSLELDKWKMCIHEILKTYEVVSDIFSFLVFKIAVTVMLWTFVTIAAMIAGVRSGLYPVLGIATIGAWAFSYYVLLTISAVYNDWFLHEIKETKLLCVRVMSISRDDLHHKAASQILRAIHYKKPKFVVYGIFTLDTGLLLTLMGIIATNVLVVVQFVVSRE